MVAVVARTPKIAIRYDGVVDHCNSLTNILERIIITVHSIKYITKHSCPTDRVGEGPLLFCSPYVLPHTKVPFEWNFSIAKQLVDERE